MTASVEGTVGHYVVFATLMTGELMDNIRLVFFWSFVCRVGEHVKFSGCSSAKIELLSCCCSLIVVSHFVIILVSVVMLSEPFP